MKTLDKGEEKIQKICDVLRRETIEPAQLEAKEIVAQAEKRREEIVREAEAEAGKIIKNAREAIEKEKNVFQSSLSQAAKQSIDTLKQEIETKLFNEQLYALIESEAAKPEVVANFIKALLKAVEKEGISAKLEAEVPKSVSAEELNRLLGQEVLKKLQKESVTLGDFAAGAKVKLVDRKMTIDMTENALYELLGGYVAREDFRKLFFGKK